MREHERITVDDVALVGLNVARCGSDEKCCDRNVVCFMKSL